MATIEVPASLRGHTEGRARVEVPATTVAEALAGLCARYPGLAARLYTPRGRLRPGVTLFVGDEDVRALGGDAAALDDDAAVVLVTAIAGG